MTLACIITLCNALYSKKSKNFYNALFKTCKMLYTKLAHNIITFLKKKTMF